MFLQKMSSWHFVIYVSSTKLVQPSAIQQWMILKDHWMPFSVWRNSSSRLIFCKNPGAFLAKIRAKLKYCDFVIFSWFRARSECYIVVWPNHKSGRFPPNAQISGRVFILLPTGSPLPLTKLGQFWPLHYPILTKCYLTARNSLQHGIHVFRRSRHILSYWASFPSSPRLIEC